MIYLNINSPGASDDAASCCVMLEILRVLSKQETRLRHNILFLFNGAEETPLQAAHGFITQHPWAENVRGRFIETAGYKLNCAAYYITISTRSISKSGISWFKWQRNSVSIRTKSCMVNRGILLFKHNSMLVPIINIKFAYRCTKKLFHIPMVMPRPKNCFIRVLFLLIQISEYSEILAMFPVSDSLCMPKIMLKFVSNAHIFRHGLCTCYEWLQISYEIRSHRLSPRSCFTTHR